MKRLAFGFVFVFVLLGACAPVDTTVELQPEPQDGDGQGQPPAVDVLGTDVAALSGGRVALSRLYLSRGPFAEVVGEFFCAGLSWTNPTRVNADSAGNYVFDLPSCVSNGEFVHFSYKRGEEWADYGNICWGTDDGGPLCWCGTREGRNICDLCVKRTAGGYAPCGN